MDKLEPIPQLSPDIDYTKITTEEAQAIPEDYIAEHSAPELIAKVRRKIIKGKIDGN